LGVIVAIFQWGWLGNVLNVENPGPILSFMPIILMAVLFGLAMDYEVFLVSGMREEFVHSGDAKQAVRRGFANGARVVTAAALIMFFVFFAFVPEGSGTIKPIALGLAVGVAFDAFLVRMTLVPAIMTLLGRAAWWMPRWLQRALPNMDIEGENLREHREAILWTHGQQGAALSAEGLLAGSAESPVGPLDFSIPSGALVLASGETTARRLVAATLGGRLDPLSGRVQVAGHPLPSESARVARLVAMADVGGLEREESRVLLGELLDERMRLSQPWHRIGSRRHRVERWIMRINAELAVVSAGRGVIVTAQSTLQELPQRERAIALATVALSEGTPVVILDLLDSFASPTDEEAFLAAVCHLTPATTTLLLFTPATIRTGVAPERDLVVLPLAAFDTATFDATAFDATAFDSTVFDTAAFDAPAFDSTAFDSKGALK